MIRSLFALGLTALSLLGAAEARAETKKFCVYDPAGRSGDYYGLMSKYATNASTWGVEVEVVPYTDELTAAKDYEAGACDGVVATGVRLQRFNSFGSSIEAIGGLPSYPLLKKMVDTLNTSPSAAALLTQNGNTVVGFIPVGAVYLFVRDRNVDTVQELAGKRIATMDYDKASSFMVQRVGAVAVAADLGSIGPKFNNGDVDACYVSAPAYRPFELQHGLGTAGGVLKAPLAQATLQVLIRDSAFPEGFATKSRADLTGRFDAALALVKTAESGIPANYWVSVPDSTQAEWDKLFQGVRVQLRDEKKAYHPDMLRVMKQMRCGANAGRAECAESKE